MAAQLPPGASLQRTEKVLEQIRAIVQKQPEVESMLAITGLNLLPRQHSLYAGPASFLLKPWSQRPGPRSSVQGLIERPCKLLGPHQGSQCADPGAAGDSRHRPGGRFRVHARRHLGGRLENFTAEIDDFLRRPTSARSCARVRPSSTTAFPEIEYVVDRERARSWAYRSPTSSARCRPSSAATTSTTSTCSGARSGSPPRRKPARGRCPSGQYPVRAHQAGRHGAAIVAGVDQADARTGLHRALQRVPCRDHQRRAGRRLQPGRGGHRHGAAGRRCPRLSYYWTGSVFQQKRSGSQAGAIFAMALVFVFLVLAAQYESWACRSR